MEVYDDLFGISFFAVQTKYPVFFPREVFSLNNWEIIQRLQILSRDHFFIWNNFFYCLQDYPLFRRKKIHLKGIRNLLKNIKKIPRKFFNCNSP